MAKIILVFFNKFYYRMLIIISYDIENDRTRKRLANKLKDFGRRAQKSVFEADVTQSELKKLKTMLSKFKMEENDSIRLYKICEQCAKNIKIWGKGEVTKDKDFYIA
ncbi:MAG: CRISPR-associated endonuclease Cas2 [Promethearchaeota archaeon]